MKRFILSALAALVLAAPAHADTCSSVEQLARVIMTKRQQGAALGEMLDVARSADDEDVSELARGITMLAFEHPSYRTPEVQARAIVDFSNRIRLRCERAIQ